MRYDQFLIIPTVIVEQIKFVGMYPSDVFVIYFVKTVDWITSDS